MNRSDSIGSFSDLYIDDLITKEQFEAKIIDIVKSDVSNGISLNAIEDYLLPFKKMLDNDQIDQNIYDKISDLLLARCGVSENTQENLNEKTAQKKTRESGGTESYLKSEDIEKPPDTLHHGKNNVPLKNQNRRNAPEFEKKDNLAETSHRGFLEKLINGDYGLAKTYWLYGVLVGIIYNIICRVVPTSGWYIFISLVYIIYAVHAIFGIWNAANKYQGQKIWAILAKIAIILGIFGLLYLIVIVLALVAEIGRGG